MATHNWYIYVIPQNTFCVLESVKWQKVQREFLMSGKK
jgi:hypothetical protein